MRSTRCCAFWGRKQASGPPPPGKQFSQQDLDRIEREGPKLEDLVHTHVVEESDEEAGIEAQKVQWVAPEVLGNRTYAKEPRWAKTQQMSIMEFHKGLRERNWTHADYREDVTPWTVAFFEDSGRFMRPSFDGYRALVTKADGSEAWVDMPVSGHDTFLRDYTAGGGGGANYRFKRVPRAVEHPSQVGYNQIFEQVFQAYEQKLPKKLEKQYAKDGWVDPRRLGPDSCPGERHLQLSYNLTAEEPSLHGFYDSAPLVAGFVFCLGFLGVSLAIGIFKPRKAAPADVIQAMEFAQSKGQARKDGKTGITFDDVAGMGYIATELQDIVSFLKNPRQYGELMTKPPKGVLLEGGPGNGKTLIAKAVAGEAQVPFYQMTGSEFVETIVGVGAARVRDLFKRARVNAPCIIFVDEVDALGVKRAAAGVRTNEEREQTLNQLLTEMDGFTPDTGVVFIGATNRADLLDPALLRSGRFDRKVRILKPDAQARYDILKVHARKKPLRDDVDLHQLARDVPGLSGAELANVLNEAALEAVRRDGDDISSADVYNALDRILMGVRKPALPDRLPVKRTLAVHEAGKGVVATLLQQHTGFLEKVERVTMVPRGSEWSRTVFLRGDDESYTLTTRARLLERIKVILAGRAAEEVVLPGGATTYSHTDLKDAARLAGKLVTDYGLSKAGITVYSPPSHGLGYGKRAFEVAVDNIDADLFGSASEGGGFQPSDDTWYTIRSTMNEILCAAYDDDVAMLRIHKAAVEATARQLLDTEVVTGSDLTAIIATHAPQGGADTRQVVAA